LIHAVQEEDARRAGTGLIVAGFVTAVLLPIVGVVIGLFVMTHPGSTAIGLWIFFLSIAVMVLSYAFLFS
jgi:hypothetical protein